MAPTVIEGTWEEVKLREAELIGRHVRVTITLRATRPQKASAKPAQPKVLRGMGAFKGKTGGSDAFAQEKRAEIEREEREF